MHGGPYEGKVKRFGALFGSLILTYALFAAAAEVAVLVGRSAEFGPAFIGFFATLFLVFDSVVNHFDISPPPQFEEAMEDGE